METTKPGEFPARIILADDDEADREVFVWAIRKFAPDMRIETADSGYHLFDTLRRFDSPPDMIFLDLNMPGMDGQECLLRLKKDERTKDVPVVIYSTANNREEVDSTYNNGATLYVQKPDSVKDMQHILHSILTRPCANFQTPQKEHFVFTLTNAESETEAV